MTVSHELRKSGKTVVLTHGAFDLFHVGHASFLKASKKLGDYLIVGVESDERISKYKSEYKPIIPIEERIGVLLSNKYVDFVFQIDELPFRKDYYSKLYKSLSPRVVSYFERSESYEGIRRDAKFNKGIKFVLIPCEINQSTSSIIEKIRATKTD